MKGGDRGERLVLQWSYCLLPHAHNGGGGRKRMRVERMGMKRRKRDF